MNIFYFFYVKEESHLPLIQKINNLDLNFQIFIDKSLKQKFENLNLEFNSKNNISFIDIKNLNFYNKLKIIKKYKKVSNKKYFFWIDIDTLENNTLFYLLEKLNIKKSNKILIISNKINEYEDCKIFVLKKDFVDIFKQIFKFSQTLEKNSLFNYYKNINQNEIIINDQFPFDLFINDIYLKNKKIYKFLFKMKNINKFIKTDNITDIYKFIKKYNYFDYLMNNNQNNCTFLFLRLLEYHRVISKNEKEINFIQSILNEYYLNKKDKIKFAIENVLYCHEFNKKNIGAEMIIKYLNYLENEEKDYGCLSNIKIFIENIISKDNNIQPIILPNIENFYASDIIFLSNNEINIKYINYKIENNKYQINDNNYRFITKNFYAKIDNNFNIISYKEMKINTNLDFYESPSYGIDDLIYFNNNFLGKQIEYSSSRVQEICIGNYDINNLELNKFKIIKTDDRTNYMKTWFNASSIFPINVDSEILYIYSLYPLKIGELINDKIILKIEKLMPNFFSYCNIETTPIWYNEKLIILIYFNDNNKNYYHLFIILDNEYNIIQTYKPFKFNNNKNEICKYININKNGDINLIFTTNYINPTLVSININDLEEISLY